MNTTLDHIGIVVPDLARAASDFEALGFRLTPEAGHTGADGKPAGSVQRSIMLHRGYIEVQQITGPPGSHLLSRAQDKFHGLHILAFGVEDAPEARKQVAAAGLPVGDVMEWARPVDTSEGKQDARFSFFIADYHAADEALLCWVHHRTPHLLRDDDLIRHANGATGLSGLTIMVADGVNAQSVHQRMMASGGTALGDNVGFGDAVLAIRQPDKAKSAGDDGKAWPAPAYMRDIHMDFAGGSDVLDRARKAGWPVEDGVIDMRGRYNIRILTRPPDLT